MRHVQTSSPPGLALAPHEACQAFVQGASASGTDQAAVEVATLIAVTTEFGQGVVRRCDARCHRADPMRREKSECVCGGVFRGIARGLSKEEADGRALEVPVEEIARIRETLLLREGEQVQTRFGA